MHRLNKPLSNYQERYQVLEPKWASLVKWH